MSQRNKIWKEPSDGHWFASQSGFFPGRRFGGICLNAPEFWRLGQGRRFAHYSVTLMSHSDDNRPIQKFRKFRHAKKHLSKWVNP